MRLPAEIFNKNDKKVRLGIGEVISVSEQNNFKEIEAYSRFLRDRVYNMPMPENFQSINSLR